jgi:hypothetical protein
MYLRLFGAFHPVNSVFVFFLRRFVMPCKRSAGQDVPRRPIILGKSVSVT